jgi:hypothetical protein
MLYHNWGHTQVIMVCSNIVVKQRSSVLTDALALELVVKKRALDLIRPCNSWPFLEMDPNYDISVVGRNQPLQSTVMGGTMPPQTSRHSSKSDGQSSLEIAKGEPEENNRLMSRFQSEEDEMPHEITSSSRRTFGLPLQDCEHVVAEMEPPQRHTEGLGLGGQMHHRITNEFGERKRVAPYT